MHDCVLLHEEAYETMETRLTENMLVENLHSFRDYIIQATAKSSCVCQEKALKVGALYFYYSQDKHNHLHTSLRTRWYNVQDFRPLACNRHCSGASNDSEKGQHSQNLIVATLHFTKHKDPPRHTYCKR